MAIQDLDTLREELPDLFEGMKDPPIREDDYIFVPIEKPESARPSDDEIAYTDTYDQSPEAIHVTENRSSTINDAGVAESARTWFGNIESPTFGPDLVVPGGPVPYDWRDFFPPPDAFGFYIPFHYGHPIWWGVYLIWENVECLGNFIYHQAGHLLTLGESVAIARMFVYGHEVFHHIVEAFSMRLEVTHRIPLYKTGFRKMFLERRNTEHAIEETLASAHAYRRVKELAFRNPNNAQKRATCLRVLEDFIRNGPPGYNKAMDYVNDDEFVVGRSEFAELNHTEALPHIPSSKSVVWNSFPHAFSGINNVNSRANYLIKRNSPLGTRLADRGHYLRYKEFAAGLKKNGCNQIRTGHGDHMIWESPSGYRFPIPRRPGDLGKGLVSQIIKQAGLSLSFSQFVNSVKS